MVFCGLIIEVDNLLVSVTKVVGFVVFLWEVGLPIVTLTQAQHWG
jgi:hypothetical protein